MPRPKKTKTSSSAIENESVNEIDNNLPPVDDIHVKSVKRSKRVETKLQLKKTENTEQNAEPVKKTVQKRLKKVEQVVANLEEDEEPLVKKARPKKTTTVVDKPEQLVESKTKNSLKEEVKVKKGRAKKITIVEGNTEQIVESKTKRSSKTAKTTAVENQTGENRLEVPKSRVRRAKTSPIITDELNHSEELVTGSEVLTKEPAVQEPKARGRKKKEVIKETETEDKKKIKVNAAPVPKKDTKTSKANPIEKQNEQTAAIEVKKKRVAVKAPEPEEQALEKETKPPAKSRGRKRAVVDTNEQNDEESEIDGAKPAKAKKPALVNTTESTYNKADFELPQAINGDGGNDKRFNLKVSSWNVAGLRAWLKKDGLKFLDIEEPDIFCMQETKCANDQLPEEVIRIPGYHPYWLCMPGGYAGVAIYSKIMPINVDYGIGHEEFDDVGRMITAEFEKFYLINVYVPNSGRKLVNLDMRMRWEETFQDYVKKLDSLKPVLICGDMNVSHLEIDLANPKANTRNAGFTKEERDKMSELLALGFVDTFRNLYPSRTGAYTFWTYMANARARNVGWRLDYFIVSQRFVSRVVDNCIRSQCKGSDHCPITLFMNL